MLKTNINRPGKPIKALIVLGILGGYVRNPIWFLITTLLTMPGFKKRLPPDLPKDFVETAALQAWMYMRLKERVGQEKAYEIMRAIVIPMGLALQQGNFRAVEAPRSFENLIAYQQRTHQEGPTRWNKMEILQQNENRYELRVHYCLFYDFHNQLGVPELTKFMCAVDNAIFNSYLPEEVTFHRNGLGNRIVDGAPACHFVIERHHPAG
jgi:predicted ArsR family transcriptional regulator